MKNLLENRFAFGIHLLVIALCITLASWYADHQKKEVSSQLAESIHEQQRILTQLADTTDRNGADDTVTRIVTDCAERSRFETLLGSLGSLEYRDLLTVQQLFENCGDFYSVRKGFMVSRLQREYEVLHEYAELYSKLDEDPALMGNVTSWGTLVSLEENRSTLMLEQVTIQREIITKLIKGSRVNSADVIEDIKRAQEVSQSLMVLDTQIDEIRLGTSVGI